MELIKEANEGSKKIEFSRKFRVFERSEVVREVVSDGVRSDGVREVVSDGVRSDGVREGDIGIGNR